MKPSYPASHALAKTFLILAMAVPLGAWAADSSKPSPTGSAATGHSISHANIRFMTTTAEAGMYEVQVSKLAADHAGNEAVKSFAQMLIDQHTATNTELMSLAQAKGVSLPSDIPASKKAAMDRLAKLNGAAFDTAFIQQVGIRDHRQDIARFDGMAKTSTDADVKAFASKTLPSLRDHLAQAQGLPKKISGGATAGPHSVDAPKP